VVDFSWYASGFSDPGQDILTVALDDESLAPSGGPSPVVTKVRRARYAPLFKDVYGATALRDVDKAYERIADAVAAFENTRLLNRFTSKYDAYLTGKATLTAGELNGLKLYEDPEKGNCAACHPSRASESGTPPLFTDFTYDNLGVPRNPDNPFYELDKRHNPAGRDFVDRGLGAVLGLGSEEGKFKVPSLRNVSVTAPYMHNGYFSELRGVVEFYNDRDTKPACKAVFVTDRQALRRGCWPRPEVAENVNRDELGNLRLTDQEIDEIVAFLRTLTDGYRPSQPR
jgi:cytochrome c peroxidase